MNDLPGQAQPPLGVTGLIGDAFSLFRDHAPRLVMLGVLPMIAATLVNLVVLGTDGLDPFAEPDPGDLEPLGTTVAGFIVVFVVQIVLYAVLASATICAARDLLEGRRIHILGALQDALSRLIPVILCSIIVMIAVYAGMIFLIVPGIYVAAMFSLVLPVLVFENAGIGALGRSIELSREYRWPLVGLFLLYLVIMIVASLVFGALQAFFALLGFFGLALSAVVSIIAGACIYGFAGVLYTLTYVRLREIKEGGGSSLAQVFD